MPVALPNLSAIRPSADEQAFWQIEGAKLDPRCIILPTSVGDFEYTVPSGQTHYCLSSWSAVLLDTAISDYAEVGRHEVRNISEPLELTGPATMIGRHPEGSATAVFLNPALATYLSTNSRNRYFEQLAKLRAMPTRYLEVSHPGDAVDDVTPTTAEAVPFYSGPYGCVVTRAMWYDATWLTLSGTNTGTEVKDSHTHTFRQDTPMMFPMRPGQASILQLGYGSPEFPATGDYPCTGGITHKFLPADFSGIADPANPNGETYTQSDDFLTDALATWTATVADATVDGVLSVDLHRAALRAYAGSGVTTYGSTYLIHDTPVARDPAGGECFIADIFIGDNRWDTDGILVARGTDGTDLAKLTIGLGDGLGGALSNFAHAFELDGSASGSTITTRIIEDGVDVGSGPTLTKRSWFRVKIVTGAGTHAGYFVQGHSAAYPMDSTSWLEIEIEGSATAKTTLTMMLAVARGSSLIGFPRFRPGDTPATYYPPPDPGDVLFQDDGSGSSANLDGVTPNVFNTVGNTFDTDATTGWTRNGSGRIVAGAASSTLTYDVEVTSSRIELDGLDRSNLQWGWCAGFGTDATNFACVRPYGEGLDVIQWGYFTAGTWTQVDSNESVTWADGDDVSIEPDPADSDILVFKINGVTVSTKDFGTRPHKSGTVVVLQNAFNGTFSCDEITVIDTTP